MRSVFSQSFFVFALLGATVSPPRAMTHGALDERILELSAQIKTNGAKGELYLQRGELHRQHGDWELALKDFDLAENRDQKNTRINFARGRTFFAAKKFNEAKAALDKFISVTPNLAEALAMRARISAKLGQHGAASADFTRAIKFSAVPDPDYFLQRAEAQVALGEFREALGGLDEGMGKLGLVISFQLRAIELEMSAQNYDAALSRLDTIVAQSPRKETWLVRRGEILEKAGRIGEARTSFSKARVALEALPENRQNIPAMADLETQIHSALRRTEPTSIAQENIRK